MVEPLAEKPAQISARGWLERVAISANINKHLSESTLTVNDHPALKVRYQTPGENELEAVYVLSGKRTFGISFSPGDKVPGNLETSASHAEYEQMLSSFRVKER